VTGVGMTATFDPRDRWIQAFYPDHGAARAFPLPSVPARARSSRRRTSITSPALREIERSIRSAPARDETDPFSVAREARAAVTRPVRPGAAVGVRPQE